MSNSTLSFLMSQCIRSVDQLEKVFRLSPEIDDQIRHIEEKYPICITPYYLSLIDKNDDQDPIRKMCIPTAAEFIDGGLEDQSGETANTVVAGLQHKYQQTALILTTNQCAMYCRHCFRKRMVGNTSDEIASQIPAMLAYIKNHSEIDNILLSGGDALINSNEVIERYLETFSKLEQLDFIRIGTRTPVVLPMRIYDDAELLEILRKYCAVKQIIIVTHFNHPKELTPEAKKAIHSLHAAGCIVRNQTVLLRGINDNPEVLSTLQNRLLSYRVIPYYIFQCRPAKGVLNEFQIPIREGSRLVEEARKRMNGQSKSLHYVMSHRTGKIEILGPMTDGKTMLFKYHQSKAPQDQSRIFLCDPKDNCWLEDHIPNGD